MKTIFTQVAWGILYLGSSLCAISQQILTYDSLAIKIEHHNPSLLAARENILIGQGKVIQSDKRKNPELSLGLEASSHLGEGRLMAGIAQEFPLTNRLAHQRAKSEWEVKAAEEEVRIAQRELLAQARMAYVKHHFLEEKRSQLTLQAGGMEELAAFLREAASKGEAEPLDATQAEFELSSFKIQAETLSLEAEAMKQELRLAIGLTSEAPLLLAEGLPDSLNRMGQADWETLPEYQLHYALIQAAKEGVIIEEAKRYGDLTVEAFTSIGREEDAPEGIENDLTIGVGVKIPFPFWDKNEGNIVSAQAAQRAAELQLNALKKKLQLKADSLEKQIHLQETHVEKLKTKLLPQAETQLDALLAAYKSGKAPFTKYLKAQEQLLSLQLRVISEEENAALLKVTLQSLTQP